MLCCHPRRNVETFQYIDHVGDLGIEVSGEDLPALFQHAAEAFFQIITDPETIREEERREISVHAASPEELLVKWLTEFVYLLDAESMLFKSFHVRTLDEHCLEAVAVGEHFDALRHPIQTVVKGVTYHQLAIYRDNGVWKARVIFDL